MSHVLAAGLSGRPRLAAFKSVALQRHSRLAARAEGGKVQELVKRDKRMEEVVDPSVFDDAPAAGSSSGSVAAAAQARAAAAAAEPAEASAAESSSSSKSKEAEGPQRCREAIDQGLERFQAGDYQAAIELFELALELPGSGFIRMAGSVREYSCPSEGEEQAALYNMACAYAKLGQRGAAITCLEALLEAGFEDFGSLRSDPDLAPLRGPNLDKLLSKYDNPMSKLFGNKKKEDLPKKAFFSPW